METVSAVVASLVVGILVGLLAFKKKSTWCPVCGATFACPEIGRHDRIGAAEQRFQPPGNQPGAPPMRGGRPGAGGCNQRPGRTATDPQNRPRGTWRVP